MSSRRPPLRSPSGTLDEARSAACTAREAADRRPPVPASSARRCPVLRVRQYLAREGGELRELRRAALAGRLGDRRIAVVGEVLERPPVSPYSLAHEEERGVCGDRAAPAAARAASRVPVGPRKRGFRPGRGSGSKPRVARRRPPDWRPERDDRRPKSSVIPVLLPGEEDVQEVVSCRATARRAPSRSIGRKSPTLHLARSRARAGRRRGRASASSARCGGSESSKIACTASSRSPSTWKSRTHCSAFWIAHSRTPRCA